MKIIFWLPVLITTLRAQWGGTTSTTTWSLISSEWCVFQIDFEWVVCFSYWYRVSVFCKFPSHCVFQIDFEWVLYPLCSVYSPACRCADILIYCRWADIPLITDGALVHAWHRYNIYPNTYLWLMCQYSYELHIHEERWMFYKIFYCRDDSDSQKWNIVKA